MNASTTPRLIDIHCHYVPYDFPGAPTPEAASRWPCMCHAKDAGATLKIGDRPFRKLDDRSWSAQRRLADMDRDGISVQVLSPMPELLSYWLDPTATAVLADRVNGAIMDVVAHRPDRFWGLGMIPMQTPDVAATSIAKLKAAGFRGVELGSNINGRYLGEAEWEPVFAAAAEQDIAIFIHALHPLQSKHLATFPDLIPFAGFPTDTGLCAASLLMSGIFERYPALRIGLSHGGGTLASIVHRLEQGWRSTNGFAGKLKISPKISASRFFLDSLVYDTDFAKYLGQIAPGRICLGTDYPYLIEQKQPAAFIAGVTENSNDAIWYEAAERFLTPVPYEGSDERTATFSPR